MKTIPLSKGYVAIVDDTDYDVLSRYRWYARITRRNVYAMRVMLRPTSPPLPRITVNMHREILGLVYGDGVLVDHKNGNGLDNRKSNLRVCTFAQNAMNRRLRADNASGYVGVSRHKSGYQAKITISKRQRYLGLFAKPEDAARAYDKAAMEAFGEFARFNFPTEGSIGA